MSRALSFVGLLSVLAGCGIVVADEETTGVRRATGEVAIKGVGTLRVLPGGRACVAR